MGEHQRSRRRRHRQRRGAVSGEDLISGLPDELLHEILIRLRSAHAAARTSVLSRRWRRVWAHLPELILDVSREGARPATLMDTVDAALAGYSAPTLERLSIALSCNDIAAIFLVGRIAPWLRFAAEHVAGELHLSVPQPLGLGEEVALELPACERARRIELYLPYARTTRLRLQASSGLFTALTSLKIGYVSMEGSDLTALVGTQCPCLRDLTLYIQLIVIFGVLIHSNSLHTLLRLCVLETRRLEILAPKLEELTVATGPMEARISAPKLVKVAWHGAYDPHLHRFVDAGRTLQLLETFFESSSLTKRFDEVDELDMNIDVIFQGALALTNLVMPDVRTYGRFLSDTNKLPKCKSFSVSLPWIKHALVPIMLQLLRSCNGTKKLRVHLYGSWYPMMMDSCLPSCRCRLEENRKIDGIDLSSLEDVEMTCFSGSHEQMELLESISSNARVLKRLLIHDKYCRRPKEVREKVRSMFHPNIKVEFCVF